MISKKMKRLLSLSALVAIVLAAGLVHAFPVHRRRSGDVIRASKSHLHPATSVLRNGVAEGDDSWDYFLFVQTSPSGNCYFENYNDCSYPSNCTQWTMHGIWPTQNGSLGPNYCTEVTFKLDQVMDLLPQLIRQWPNIITDTSLASFWAHEYEKHGSCAAGLNAMSSEHAFFATTLELHQRYNFTTVLEKAGLVPSLTIKYHTDDFNKAFQNSMGVTPLLECLYSPQMGQVLYQISVCLKKDFSLMPCEAYVFSSSKTRCYEDQTFLYIPKNAH